MHNPGLDDLEKVNKTLEQDVTRFRELQQNKKKLDAYRGKVLWVEADVLKDNADSAKVALAKADGEFKEIAKQVKTRDASM